MIRSFFYLAFCFLLPLMTSNVFAEDADCSGKLVEPGVLKCTLSSGKWSATVEWNLADGDLEMADTFEAPNSEKYDLSMTVEVTRSEETWSASMFLLSRKIQDEFTDVGFTWKNGARGEVGREVIESRRTPDKKKYTIVCTVE